MFHAILQYVQLTGRLYAGGRAPAIVYSKERTGSVAVYQSLKMSRAPAIATHYLDPDKIVEGKLSGSAKWASQHIVKPRRPAKFISLIRNPFDNLLSTFARQEFVDRPLAEGRSLTAALDVTADSLADRFRNHYLGKGEYLRELNWFDAELKVALAIDVFAHEFDKAAGIGHIVDGPFELLLLRTELPDDAKATAIAEFLGLPNFGLQQRPISGDGEPGVAGESSPYRLLYRELKSRVQVQAEYLDVIANSKLAGHFIDNSELAASRAKWNVGSIRHAASDLPRVKALHCAPVLESPRR